MDISVDFRRTGSQSRDGALINQGTIPCFHSVVPVFSDLFCRSLWEYVWVNRGVNRSAEP